MRVRWTRRAQQDRAAIRQYIAADSPRAAVKMEALFNTVIARLAQFPESGRLGRVSGTRELVAHRNYTLVYKVQKDSIDVVALLHASQLWPPRPE